MSTAIETAITQGVNSHTASRKISDIVWMLIFMVAGFYDALQFTLSLVSFGVFGIFFNWIIAIWGYLTFIFWLMMLGVDFRSPWNFFASNGSFIFELIPVLNNLPTFLMAITAIYTKIKAEELIQLLPENIVKGTLELLRGKGLKTL